MMEMKIQEKADNLLEDNYLGRAEVAMMRYRMHQDLYREIYSGTPAPDFTVIPCSRNYLRRVFNAVIGHEHNWAVRENTPNGMQYRYIVLICRCGEYIRVFVPPVRTFEGIEKLVNTSGRDYKYTKIPDLGSMGE